MAKKLFARMMLVMLAVGVLTACDDKKRTDVSSATIVCDENFENIISQEIDVFEYVYPKNFIIPTYCTQAVCIDSLFSGNTRTAIIGRDLTKDERIALKKKYSNSRSMQIAVDAVAIILNPENEVDRASVSEIRDILTGKITRWNELDPRGADRRIDVYIDNAGSGIATYMRDSVLDGKAFGPNIYSAGTLANVFEKVKERPGAMGIIGVSWLTRDLTVDTMAIKERVAQLQSEEPIEGQAINDRMDASGVNVMAIVNDGLTYKPYQQYIYDGSYPFTRPIYMVTTGSPVGAVGKFYTFVTSNDGQRLIMKTGVMPARMQVQVYEVVTK